MRILLYLLLLVSTQGALARLLPTFVSPPDLFLLTAVALAFRLRPLPALLAGYGIGLVQDVLGQGLLGFHAAGVAGGVLLLLGVRKFLSDRGALQTLVTVAVATLGQWLAFLILTYWLRAGLVTVGTLTSVLPVALLTTLVCQPVVERLATWAFGKRPGPEQGLA
ncbi:rod shape-determining protein MreD [Deinococcus pimensis]|uniref:rod shape-determining protein MreD n=1 Tax=Deinococcus pimensis TaxID=309888 RepID=UPI000486772E|nr:rod shape-determining protein MreD [Deinococcus pimensis]